MTVCGLMRRKASMTTLPLTDWMGSITTATDREFKDSKDLRRILIKVAAEANGMYLLRIDIDAR